MGAWVFFALILIIDQVVHLTEHWNLLSQTKEWPNPYDDVYHPDGERANQLIAAKLYVP